MTHKRLMRITMSKGQFSELFILCTFISHVSTNFLKALDDIARMLSLFLHRFRLLLRVALEVYSCSHFERGLLKSANFFLRGCVKLALIARRSYYARITLPLKENFARLIMSSLKEDS